VGQYLLRQAVLQNSLNLLICPLAEPALVNVVIFPQVLQVGSVVRFSTIASNFSRYGYVANTGDTNTSI
jgi:hypothetical protein